MKFEELIPATNSKICPVHHIRPVVNVDNDHITIRCCCDFFTGKYISDVENKFKDQKLEDLLEAWEIDLELAEIMTA